MSQVIKRAKKERVLAVHVEESLSILDSDPDEGVEALGASGKRRPRGNAYVPDDECTDESVKDAKETTADAAQPVRQVHAAQESEDGSIDKNGEEKEEPEEELTEDVARALVQEGDRLSGDELKAFLKQNFTDFVNERLFDLADIDDI